MTGSRTTFRFWLLIALVIALALTGCVFIWLFFDSRQRRIEQQLTAPAATSFCAQFKSTRL